LLPSSVDWTVSLLGLHSLDRLSKRLRPLQENRNGDIDPIITFDKDDVDTLDFVAASANLRSTIFGIEAKSKFDIKRMLMSIIPLWLD
jgi:ubiquitin-like 1-activating enzyme E1 B